MGTNDTKTPNGDSKNYKVELEEAKNLIGKTDACRMTVVPTANLLPPDYKNPMSVDCISTRVEKSKKIKEGILPRNQGDTLIPNSAAELNSDGITIVLDGRPEAAQEVPENETQKIAREAIERARSAEEKYAKNNISTEQSTTQGQDQTETR